MTDAGALMGLASGVRRVEQRLNQVLAVIVVALMCLSAALAFVSVVLRYAFGSSFGIGEELCRFAIVYATLLYFGPLITRNAHLTMSIVTDMMPPRVARMFDLGLHVLIAALLVWLFQAAWAWEAGLYAMGLTTMSGEMKAWVPSAALPVGVALALVYAVMRVVYRAAGLDFTPTAKETE